MSLWPYSEKTLEGARAYWEAKNGKPAFHRLTADEQRMVVQGFERQEKEKRNGDPRPGGVGISKPPKKPCSSNTN